MKSFLSYRGCLSLNKVDRKCYNLSTGQVNDAFESALGRSPTGTELSQWTNNGSLNGSTGQATLITQLNPKASTGSNTSVGQITDPMVNAQAAQQMQLTANQPAISTLTQRGTDLQTQYQTLLDSITSDISTAEQPEINTATAANSAQLAARGIDPNSPYGQTSLANAVLPVTGQSAGLMATAKTTLGGQEAEDLNTLASNIASLSAGNVPNALSYAGGINTAQTNAATSIATNKPYTALSPGQALGNTQTGVISVPTFNTPTTSGTPSPTVVPSTTTLNNLSTIPGTANKNQTQASNTYLFA
jgi:hypothetical protein